MSTLRLNEHVGVFVAEFYYGLFWVSRAAFDAAPERHRRQAPISLRRGC